MLELGGGPSLRNLLLVLLLLIFDQHVSDVDADEMTLRDLIVQDTHRAKHIQQLDAVSTIRHLVVAQLDEGLQVVIDWHTLVDKDAILVHVHDCVTVDLGVLHTTDKTVKSDAIVLVLLDFVIRDLDLQVTVCRSTNRL